MGKTYSCDLESCAMVFSQAYELRKHKIEHEDAVRLFYCKCAGCNFHNLDPRNLVYFATNDRSLLTKHRKRAHAYILRRRAPYKDSGTFGFVYYHTPPSPGSTATSAATSSATSRAINAESAKKPYKHPKSSRLRPVVTVNEYERANVGSPDATGPVPVPPVSQTPCLSRPTKKVAPNARGKGHTESLDWLQQHVGRSQFLGHMDHRPMWSYVRDWHWQHYADRRQRKGLFD